MEETHTAVGGDFNSIFDSKDYLAMVNIRDEATCVLRGHLILEEVLNIWSSKLTNTEDLFAGTVVYFKTKLCISKNLGMSEDLYAVLDKINGIRNRFSHRKGYQLEKSEIESLKIKVDEILPGCNVTPCETFEVEISGVDEKGNPDKRQFFWVESDNRLKFVIVFVNLMLRIIIWIQKEFNSRGIEYSLIKS